MKGAVGVALALQLAAVFGFYGMITAIVTSVVLLLVGANELGFDLFKEKIELCDAHVYKHLENGTLLYCDSEQATHADYQYLGTAKVNCKNVGNCSLA